MSDINLAVIKAERASLRKENKKLTEVLETIVAVDDSLEAIKATSEYKLEFIKRIAKKAIT